MLLRTLAVLITLVFISGFSGCGGGGSNAPTNQANTVVVKTADSSGAAIYGVEFKTSLPAGVTLKTVENGDVDPSVIVASGNAVGAIVTTNYVSSTTSQTLKVSVVPQQNHGSFAIGEFLTVTCILNSGASLNPSDFSFSDFKAFDSNGFPIPGVSGVVVQK